jgi:hypothetical protein
MDWKFVRSVLWRALVLFVLANMLFVSLDIESLAGKLSLYNHVVPGRKRFPFGETPAQSYNVSVYNLNAMFAAHEIAGQPKPAGEYRVLFIGDSSIWGTLLKPDETLAGQIEAAGQEIPQGKRLRIYNLGYPTMSTLKDLLILEQATRYQPDLIIWSITLESLVQDNQFNSPLVMQNLDRVRALNRQYSLDLALPDAEPTINLWEKTVYQRRRALADLTRLQMYGILWAATGLDQYYPPAYSLALRDFEVDDSFHGLGAPLRAADLALNTLRAGVQAAGKTPVLFVNEPIMISSGANSDIRYNFYYPRWAYDDYRVLLSDAAASNQWLYFDTWDAVQESEFTNTAVHLSPFGVAQESEILSGILPEVIRANRVPEQPALAQEQETAVGTVNVPAESTTPEATATLQALVPASATSTATQGSGGQLSAGQLSAGSEPAADLSQLVPTSGVCLPPEKWQEMPVVPEYVTEETIHLYQEGIQKGNNPKVFSVVGDCQSVPQVFLAVFDNPKSYKLGAEFSYLQPAIDQFSGSFNRKGLARKGGMNVAAVLSPLHADPKTCDKNETPLQCELRVYKPSIVIVSLEEWWSKSPLETYEGYLRNVLDEIIAHGAVPILSTKADNLEGNHGINQTIVRLACEYQLPLWNFWGAVQPLPNHGLWTDGFHLTVGLYNFEDPKTLKAGRSIRNLTGLQVLDRVWRGLNRLPAGGPAK